MIDNLHKVEIALIDLGYIKVLNVNYFRQDETISFEEKVNFKLPESFNDHTHKIDKNSSNFRLIYESQKIEH